MIKPLHVIINFSLATAQKSKQLLIQPRILNTEYDYAKTAVQIENTE